MSHFPLPCQKRVRQELSGTHFWINNRSSNNFSTFPHIQKLKPDLCHLTPCAVIFSYLIPGCLRNQFFCPLLQESTTKSSLSILIFVSSLTLVSILQKESAFYGRNNDAGSDLILSSDSIDMEVLSSLPAQQLSCVREIVPTKEH